MLERYTIFASARPLRFTSRMTTPLLNRFARRASREVVTAAIAGCIFALLLVGRTSTVSAEEIRFTVEFHKVEEAVERYIAQFGRRHVLFVVDIDNTLLAMNQDLGSDQWFVWQDFLIKYEPESPYRVADTFDGLLDVQGILYNLGRMHPPQRDLPKIIARIQDQGVSTLVLTSRGDEFRAATERELSRNGYDFDRSKFTVRDVMPDTYLPYDLEEPEKSGLTAEEVIALGLKEPKPVSYSDGIMMSSGQNKAAMLLTLLHRSDRDVKAIVYADDHGRHVAGMFAAIVHRGKEIAAFHYQREDVRVQAFQYSDKNDVTRRWHQLNDTLQAVFE